MKCDGIWFFLMGKVHFIPTQFQFKSCLCKRPGFGKNPPINIKFDKLAYFTKFEDELQLQLQKGCMYLI